MTKTTTYPPSTWRLLHSGPADGFANMAVDEAILVAVTKGRSPPTLRFYAWQPPCLSIGVNQAMREVVDVERCQAHRVRCVRRPTGGRAILHAEELTYSVIAPPDDPRLQGGVPESYRRLSVGLLAGLRELGAVATSAGSRPATSGDLL